MHVTMIKKKSRTISQRAIIISFKCSNLRIFNLTLKQRQAIRDRQRLLYANMTSEQKQAKRTREKACRMKRSNAPGKKSITMINPSYKSSDSD